ncbi:NADP-dependent oxidoreductase [Amycolatopsis sp. CA-230715]|uniref:NADP-dependent oxidoreductase n=1 Tax=Amycolatopsis sp. CA-230715 TaxID=2745196 RepID=UPI001C015E57|nr:NADP-dependent oxidoreductase [Amycolatopsis sp. CA-230715]QWF84594.1 2-haloacrylate reductase [Amycolatopsis sp. CA-230715]
MQAIQFTEFGGPDVLKLADLPVPEPGKGQVRIAVRAAGVNPLDTKLRSGAMAAMMGLEPPHVPGFDVAGVVDAVGEGASFAVGDEVFGWSNTGSYAEYALATIVARKPAELSWEVAAGIPTVGETAVRALEVIGVKAGDVVLIHGASGGVGRIAVQVALAAGATVVGTGGPSKLDDIRSLGARAVTYGEGLVDRVREIAPEGIDAVFDTTGYGVLKDSIALRGGTDRIVTIADGGAADLGIPFTGSGNQTGELLDRLAAQLTDGSLVLAVGTSYPLAEAAKAHQESESGHPTGKITITVK